jgi:centrosomal protein CEP290
VNDLYDETEDLRERLGLDPKEPLDLTEYKKKKTLRLQEDRALNRVLQKEVCFIAPYFQQYFKSNK